MEIYESLGKESRLGLLFYSYVLSGRNAPPEFSTAGGVPCITVPSLWGYCSNFL